MPTQERRGEICETKDVETAGENDTGETVETWHDPGNLRLIDREVGGHGTEFALGNEDLVGVGWR